MPTRPTAHLQAATTREERGDRAIYDVLVRRLVINGDELDFDAVRGAVDEALAEGDVRAIRRTLIDEAATALAAIERLPGPHT